MEKIGVVIAAHGDVPLDYDLEQAEQIMEKISDMVKKLPRNIGEINDPHKLESGKLAEKVKAKTGLEVEVGYSEFCSPSIPETINQLASKGFEKIIVVPLFLTHCRHTERDIPEILEKVKKQVTNVEILYIEPILEGIADILAEKIMKNINKNSNPGKET
ncbi:MAG: sirohydrochlorin chelatase [Candidatus Jordarchaeum sp.]|uniref:sirohydrochlorin chelatase n=1 Tax=Candidatus Jordarchaeum sp. TaxID=2823881 RepID=UPI00404B52BB